MEKKQDKVHRKINMKIKYNPEKFKIKTSENVDDFLSNWIVKPDSLPLNKLGSYLVYAIEYNKNGFERFCILDDSGVIYPNSYPSDLFELIDTRLSKFWENGVEYSELERVIAFPTIISFKEWRENKYFQSEMFENVGNANFIFSTYKTMMDLEFCDYSFPTSLQIDDDLFLCSNCEFATENNDNLEKFQCPKCFTIQNKR